MSKQHTTCENHQTEIDWYYTNRKGMPALVCKQCRNIKGVRKGKPKFITWLSERDCFKIHYGAQWEKYYDQYCVQSVNARHAVKNIKPTGDTAAVIAEQKAFNEPVWAESEGAVYMPINSVDDKF